jgi:hypothetical protein
MDVQFYIERLIERQLYDDLKAQLINQISDVFEKRHIEEALWIFRAFRLNLQKLRELQIAVSTLYHKSFLELIILDQIDKLRREQQQQQQQHVQQQQ